MKLKRKMSEATKLKIINYFWIVLTVIIAICTLYVSIFTIRDTIRAKVAILAALI